MQRKHGIWIALPVLLLALSACNETSEVAPTASDYQKQRAEILEKHKASSSAAAVAKQTAAVTDEESTGDGGAILGDIGSFFYDPVGKRDPFRSFIQEHKTLDEGIDSPLVKFDLGQLEVAGVVWRADRRRALVLDPSGQAYVVSEGDLIGKNAGEILEIDDSTMLVREKYVDFHGEQTVKEIEMRIRQSQGG